LCMPFLVSSFVLGHCHTYHLHSFPTRRSSDLSTFSSSSVEISLFAPEASTTATPSFIVTIFAGKPTHIAVPPFSSIYNIYCKYRSEEHTSELQSRFDLVCRLLLEKNKKTTLSY